jgi:hypothetical protein
VIGELGATRRQQLREAVEKITQEFGDEDVLDMQALLFAEAAAANRQRAVTNPEEYEICELIASIYEGIADGLHHIAFDAYAATK